ncbi:parallel beta helix pectate lyase-like protein [Kribbella sp. VKM Ac-2527]|uniref:Parallel beta helix pectate lyase-like protein n=1 Tax=Kribbella caucasensis TaxID=2512215 RepID=A0A4R6KRF9_9ACTN|nr:right-handed parallel beta-helix repeat-containing protein [Kribbella sp. VKM Ac-2527]TDO52489.1 parallel beta helix pectate lyase-like protein [Kribbella sp. VKM Ac-2527]
MSLSCHRSLRWGSGLIIGLAVGLLVPAAVFGGSALGAGAAPGAHQAGCTSFWVSPDGNDSAIGTQAKPWRTVEHARDTIRARNLNKHLSCDLVVNLKAGTYKVDKTITFDDRDSGSNGQQVVYRSADGPGKAVFEGATEVTGWTPYKDGIFKAPVDVDQPFYTVYAEGQRATTARYPNRRSDEEWAPYLRSILFDPTKEAVRDQIGFNAGDIDPAWDLRLGTSWPAQVTVWSGGSWSWFTDTVPMLDINFTKRRTTLVYPARYGFINSGGGSRYFVQNSLSLLDQAGEYYLDYPAKQLYYKPAGGTMDGVEVLRPTVTQVFTLTGASTSRRVENLTLDGLAIQHTDFMDWYRYGWNGTGDSGFKHKYPKYDTQIELPRNRWGAITLTNTRGVRLTRLHIQQTGFTAIELLFANERTTVSDSLLEHLGNDGIKVEGGWPGEGDLAHDNTFTNNYIHHVGELVPGDSAGVEIMNSGRNEISHTVVEHGARYGISIESRPEIPNADNYTGGNQVHHVRLSHLAKDSGDTGPFYAYGVRNQPPYTPDAAVSQLIIDDAHADPSMPDSKPYGVHMDFGGCGFAFSDVKVTNTESDPYHGPSAGPCSTFANVSWEAGFDDSRMQYDRIGVLPSFPYEKP